MFKQGARLAILMLVAGQGGIATASPVAVRHGRTIHVSLAGRTQEAVALRATAAGWLLDLGGTPAGATVSVRDVTTVGASPTRYELNVVPGLLLDLARFRADHAYRVYVRRGTEVLGSALIYLQPPPRGNGRVVFDDRDTAKSAARGRRWARALGQGHALANVAKANVARCRSGDAVACRHASQPNHAGVRGHPGAGLCGRR